MSPAPSTEAIGGGLGQQVLLELRKSSDTPAGLVLSLFAPISGVAGALFTHFALSPQTLSDVVKVAVAGPLVLVAVLGLRSTAAEWGHRGVQHTFAQNPRRAEVLTAKLCSVALVTALTWMVAMLASIAVAVVRGMGQGGTEDVVLLSAMLALQLSALFGAAVGAAAMSVAVSGVVVALTAALMVPPVNEFIGRHAPWASLPRQVHRLVNGLWIDLGTFLYTVIVWLLVPLVVGTWRWLRRDILH